MKTTLYITRTGDMIRFGKPARVTLDEFPEVSRTWTRRVEVELPEGFTVCENYLDQPMICRGGEGYELTVNTAEVPCIIDHTQRGGPYIQLDILSEGW